MTADQITTILTNILTGGGVATFLWFLMKGLRQEIKNLKGTISAQEQTLKVMERRIAETEKVSDLYKSLIEDFPVAFEQYKSLIINTKDGIIKTQQEALAERDEQLAAASAARLQKLDQAEQVLTELPNLVRELTETTQAINQRFQVIAGATAGFSSETGTLGAALQHVSLA
jgi:DNA repair exonuclease SbcCD ATPase subunit